MDEAILAIKVHIQGLTVLIVIIFNSIIIVSIYMNLSLLNYV